MSSDQHILAARLGRRGARTGRHADWPIVILLIGAVLLVGAVAAFSASPTDVLTVAPLALIALSLASRRYFGVETLVRMIERRRRARLRAPVSETPSRLQPRSSPALRLLAGSRVLRGPPLAPGVAEAC